MIPVISDFFLEVAPEKRASAEEKFKKAGPNRCMWRYIADIDSSEKHTRYYLIQ